MRLGHDDLESLEFDIRGSMHEVGRKFLERLLSTRFTEGEREEIDEGYRFVGEREKTILTVLGEVRIMRRYYYDRERRNGFCPQDKALDVVGTRFSPGMRRIMGKVGAYQSFGLGEEDIEELAGVHVTAKEVERIAENLGKEAEIFLQDSQSRKEESKSNEAIKVGYIEMDGTGVPMVGNETEGRQGKGADGEAKTREAKLGSIFTQTSVDKNGYPIRDELSTTYTGAIETAEEFGKRINTEAVIRRIRGADRVCVIGDGATWIWNIAGEYFPGAVEMIDQYHVREHYWNVADLFFGKDKKRRQGWAEKRKMELDNGEVEKVIKSINRLNPSTAEQKEACRREIGYFETNKRRMRYDRYRREGLFVGSGVIEAGCRSIIAQRLKQSGMHWSARGANGIIALRCCILSGLWEDFWEYRAAA